MKREDQRRGLVTAAVVVLGLIGLVIASLTSDLRNRRSEADNDVTLDSTDRRSEPRARDGVSLDSAVELLHSDKAVITGMVRDQHNRGVAGATVCAWPNQSELHGADDGRPHCTESGPDGHYRIENLWPVSTGVSASAPELRPGRWSETRDGRRRYELRLSAGQERAIDFTLKPGGVAARGVVKDISGGVIEGAIVSTSGGWWVSGDGRAVAVTDEDGRFELWTSPGRFWLQASAQGYASAETEAAAPTDRAELFLTPESTISGVVVRADTGAPVAGASVSAQASGFFARGRGTALSDEDGRFRIAGLEPGIYDVTALTDELYGESAEQVHLGLAENADTKVRVHPAFSVRARVVIDESDEPCEDAKVHLTSDQADKYAVADEDGEVLFRAALPDEYRVQIECKGYTAEQTYESVVVVDANIDGLEWKVHPGLAIRGVVVDQSGAELESVHVNAKFEPKPGDDPRGQRTSQWGNMSEADGTFELRGLLPGAYELDVWSDTHPSLAEPLVVELGETDVDGLRLVLPATAGLQGIVRDEAGQAVAGVTVSSRLIDRADDGANEQTLTGDDGRFSFERLRTGEYRVLAQLDWNNQMRAPGTTDDDLQGETVSIVEGSTAEVELVVERRSGIIRGRVLDGDGGPVTDAFIDASRLSDSAAAGSARPRTAMRWGWNRQPVLSDQDGAFELRELAEGNYLIRAYREGGGEALLEGVALGSTVELTIVETGRIAGVVALADGGSPERFLVKALDRSTGLERQDQFFRTDGVFELRELPPGNYDLTVNAREGAAKLEVELAAGQSLADLRIELAAKITIKGRLIDAATREPIPGYRVKVIERYGSMIFTDEDPPGKRRTISDADGRFEVDDAPTGRVQLWIIPREFTDEGKYGWTRQVATLAKQPSVQDIGELELHASRLAERETPGDIGYKTKQTGPELEVEDKYFEVAVIRPGGPADGTELAVGDRITAVDGHKVTGVDSYRYGPLIRAPEGTVIELTIEGREPVSIELGPPVEW